MRYFFWRKIKKLTWITISILGITTSSYYLAINFLIPRFLKEELSTIFNGKAKVGDVRIKGKTLILEDLEIPFKGTIKTDRLRITSHNIPTERKIPDIKSITAGNIDITYQGKLRKLNHSVRAKATPQTSLVHSLIAKNFPFYIASMRLAIPDRGIEINLRKLRRSKKSKKISLLIDNIIYKKNYLQLNSKAVIELDQDELKISLRTWQGKKLRSQRNYLTLNRSTQQINTKISWFVLTKTKDFLDGLTYPQWLQIDDGFVEVQGHLDDTKQFKLSVLIQNLTVDQPIFDSHPTTPLHLAALFKGRLINNKVLGNAKITVVNTNKGAQFELDSRIKAQIKPYKSFEATLKLPPTHCHDFFQTLPFHVAPVLEKARLGGYMQTQIHANFEWKDAFNPDIQIPQISIQCYIQNGDKRLEAGLLNHVFDPFKRKNYVSLEEISNQFVNSVVTAEDGRFWAHKGFDYGTIQTALNENLKARKILIGGSTISQQLAKNLYLSNNRNISRKIQEMILTKHLETVLPKEKIMEIYLNIIEFGPDIYGIKNASLHFFNKLPKDLSLVESAYLTMLIPSPKKRYFYFCRNSLSQNFASLMRSHLKRMLKSDRIDESQYYQSLSHRLGFSPFTSRKACAPHTNLARENNQKSLADF